jgi:hypothetical protein
MQDAHRINETDTVMDTQEQIAILVETISHQGGQIEALAAALLTTLHLARGTPALKQAVEDRLEKNYAGLLARSENADYVAGFERLRDLVQGALK